MVLDRDPWKSRPQKPQPGAMTPSRLHFCWIGPGLGWAQAFAVLSASEQGQLAEITLHHTDVLTPGAVLDALTSTPGVRLSHIDPAEYLAATGQLLGTRRGLGPPLREHGSGRCSCRHPPRCHPVARGRPLSRHGHGHYRPSHPVAPHRPVHRVRVDRLARTYPRIALASEARPPSGTRFTAKNAAQPAERLARLPSRGGFVQ